MSSTTTITNSSTNENKYICEECGYKQYLPMTRQILCGRCNGRIMRKLRTKHIVQYTAR